MSADLRLRPMAGIALAYALCGIIALHTAIPPGYVAPLFPSAGIALAGMLIYGRRIWPAVMLGAFVTNVEAVLQTGLSGWGWVTPVCVSIGASLQALAGHALAQRWVGFPNALDTPPAISRFLFAAAPISCLVSASCGVGALVAFGSIPPAEALFSWWNWWAGDFVGILIAAPLTLVFFGQPRRDWSARRISVALPLAIALLLLVALELQVGHWEQQRLQARFERDARYLSSLLKARFTQYLDVLQATERLIAVTPGLSNRNFQDFSLPWIKDYAGLQAIGWIAQDDLTGMGPHAGPGAGSSPSAAHDKPDDLSRPPGTGARTSFPVRLIAREGSDLAAPGLKLTSSAESAEALNRTLADGKAAATRAFALNQNARDRLGIVVFHQVRGHGGAAAASAQGVVFVAWQLDEAVARVLSQHPVTGIHHCLFEDTGQAGSLHLVVGDAHCLDNKGDRRWAHFDVWEERFDFGGRTWSLRFSASEDYAIDARGWEAWILLAIGLLSTGILGAFLLSTTGHARRVEELVEVRTNELADAGRRLAAQQAMLSHAERIAHLGSWEFDLASGSGHWSAELHHIFGVPGHIQGSLEALIHAVHADDRERLREAIREVEAGRLSTSLDIRLPDRDGERRIVHFTIEAAQDARGRSLRGTVQDVTATREAEAHIHYLAHYDPLTGLPNRSTWISRAEQALAIARRNQLRIGVLFLDLDNFKKINDTLGHPVGDRLLAAAAHRLSLCLREEDVLARIGGDEFVILLPQLGRPDDAATVARKLIACLTEAFPIEGQDLTISTSIGIALYPGNGADVDMLLKHADTAMYDAKSQGRNDFRFFTPDMNSRAYARLMLENALRRALEKDELVLEYQPQWRLPEQRLIGMEALVRWNHPERGRVSPMEFIPVAEETGMIQAIGDWVLHTACRQQARWMAAGFKPLPLALNISALQFRKPGFADRMQQIFREHGVPPDCFELEITESALMQPSMDAQDELARLRAMGVGLALDDFGTGYSSLSYLKRLPLTRLKIDRSFVLDLPGDAEDAAIATATLSIARDLGLEVLAEGVENAAQRDFLLERGCRMMQGYMFSHPLGVADMTLLLDQVSTAAA